MAADPTIIDPLARERYASPTFVPLKTLENRDMPRTSRRAFMETASVIGAGYFVAAGTRPAMSNSANEKLNVACIGVGGKGGSLSLIHI